MALISCPEPECGRKISDQAAFCPHCGRTIQAKDSRDSDTPTAAVAVASGEELPPHIRDETLDLSDLWLASMDLTELVSSALPLVKAGRITDLTISGSRWTDQDITQICDQLVPGSSTKWISSRLATHHALVQQATPSLTRLEVTLCGQLTQDAMRDLSRLSTITEVNLLFWLPGESSVMAIQEFQRLPNLKRIHLPGTLYSRPYLGSTDITERDILVRIFQKNLPQVEVV